MFLRLIFLSNINITKEIITLFINKNETFNILFVSYIIGERGFD